MSTLVDPYFSLQRPADQLELALVHDRTHDPTALVSILLDGGLPPTAGVLALDRIADLAAAAPEATVLVADVARPDGLAAVRALRRDGPSTRIVVVARDDNNVLARQILNAGADAFVPELEAPDALAPAVRAVVAGMVCVPRAARRLVAKPTFSHREKEVLELLVAGMTNRQIAGQLFLAESTVKSHLASAFAKLSVRSRKDAAAILLDPAEGLVDIALTPESPAAGAFAAGRAGSAPAPLLDCSKISR